MSVSGATSKLVFRTRMDTVKNTFDTLKRESAASALLNQVEGFGRNNRQLLRNFLGIPR